MPREYYEFRAPSADRHLRPAGREQQDAYWLLRSQLTGAIARDWPRLMEASPNARSANQRLAAYVERHPNVAFRIFRPEDAQTTIDARAPGSFFLR